MVFQQLRPFTAFADSARAMTITESDAGETTGAVRRALSFAGENRPFVEGIAN
jgi:hypothetical protein